MTLKRDDLLPSFAFKFKSRRYIKRGKNGEVVVEVPGMAGWDAVNNLSSMKQIADKLVVRHEQRSVEVRRQRDYLTRTVAGRGLHSSTSQLNLSRV